MNWETIAGPSGQNIFFAGLVLLLILIIYGQNIKNRLFKKKNGKSEKIDFVATSAENVVAPRFPWQQVLPKRANISSANPVESVKNTIKQLDIELKKQEENVQLVLKDVLEIQTDIYNKMQDYYEISQHLEKQEGVLRNNLEVLKAARPEQEEDRCPSCDSKLSILNGQKICLNKKCKGGKK